MAFYYGDTHPSRHTGVLNSRSDGTYTVTVTLNGVRHTYAAADRTSAEALLQGVNHTLATHAQHHLTVQDWMSTWFSDLAQSKGLRPRTLDDYRTKIEAYVLPHLGSIALVQVNHRDIQRMVNTVRSDIQRHWQAISAQRTARSQGACRQFDGIRTVRGTIKMLEQSFRVARERGLLPHDPLAGVIVPNPRPSSVLPLSDTHLVTLLHHADQQRDAALWYLYALLGLRRGEALGLRWGDVDGDRAVLTIAQQVQTTNTDGVQISPPKSASSVRQLPLHPFLLAKLAAHRDQQRSAFGRELALVFPSAHGTPIWPRNLNRTWAKLKVRAQLPETCTLHALRHTFATLLDEAGASDSIKGTVLGHSKRTITQHYTHSRLPAIRHYTDAVVERIVRQQIGGAE